MLRYCLIIVFLVFYLFSFSQKINRLNKHGERKGKWIIYHDSLKTIKSFEGRFMKGNSVGRAYYYNFEGGLDRRDIHRKRYIKTTFFNNNGSKNMEGRSRIENLPERVHFYFYGRWKYYDENGKLVKYGYYEKGKLVRTRYMGEAPLSNDTLVNFLVTLEENFNSRNKAVLDSIACDYHNIASREKFQRRIYRTDTATFNQLAAFLRSYGYTSKREFGEAASIPFYILSNAPLTVKQKYLPLLKNAADAGDIEWRTFAFFIDKIKVAEGKKKIYGTQYYFNTNYESVYYPVEDPENLKSRRQKVGLE